MILNALGGLGITFLLVSWSNIYGLYIGTALVTIGCFFFVQKTAPYRFSYFWNSEKLWKELRLGVPLLAIAFLAQFLKSLDKLMIAKYLGFYEVGLYSLVMMAHTYVQSLHMMFAHVLFPNIQEEYGRHGSVHSIKQYLLKPVYAFSVLIPFLCGLCIFLVPLVTELFIPTFAAGIPAMKVYLIGAYFLMLVTFSSNFLLTLDQHLANIPILILSIGLNFGLNFFFIKAGWGFFGVAIGTVLSFLFYGLATFIVALRNCADFREIVSVLSKLFLILGLFFGGIFAIDGLVTVSNIFGKTLLKTGLFLLFSFPFFSWMEKKLGVLKPIRQMLGQKFFAAKRLEEIETVATGDSV
jgi:O-antigen/teichoic acid export membrane protein